MSGKDKTNISIGNVFDTKNFSCPIRPDRRGKTLSPNDLSPGLKSHFFQFRMGLFWIRSMKRFTCSFRSFLSTILSINPCSSRNSER